MKKITTLALGLMLASTAFAQKRTQQLKSQHSRKLWVSTSW